MKKLLCVVLTLCLSGATLAQATAGESGVPVGAREACLDRASGFSIGAGLFAGLATVMGMYFILHLPRWGSEGVVGSIGARAWPTGALAGVAVYGMGKGVGHLYCTTFQKLSLKEGKLDFVAQDIVTGTLTQGQCLAEPVLQEELQSVVLRSSSHGVPFNENGWYLRILPATCAITAV